LWQFFVTWQQKKGGDVNCSNDFLEKWPKAVTLQGKEKVELARFRVQFPLCHHYVAEFEKKKLLLLLTSSQIWLCPLMDDRWSTYPTKLKRINHVPFFY
jgi:hypothetical protein